MTAFARQPFAATAFATIVTALVLTSQPGQAREDHALVAAPSSGHVIHELPRVVVTGRVQRAEVPRIVELPRVVVTARRVDPAASVVVQAPVRIAGERT